jgi:hypothetical protein
MPQPQTTSASTITVGCKLPNGLIIQVGKTRLLLNGSNTQKILGGYGLTHNVDASFFAEWMRLNESSVLVKKGIIFAQEKEVNAKAQASDTRDVNTGLEPMSKTDKPTAGVSQTVPLDPGQKVETFDPKKES